MKMQAKMKANSAAEAMQQLGANPPALHRLAKEIACHGAQGPGQHVGRPRPCPRAAKLIL